MKKGYVAMAMAIALGAIAFSGCGGNSSSNQTSQEETSDEKNESESVVQREQEKTEEKTDSSEEITIYKIGDIWKVDGQWAITVTGIEETGLREGFEEKTPGAVYIITYMYENLGYNDPDEFMDGLYVEFNDMIVDNSGKMGYGYPGDITLYPHEVPVGAYCKAQSCIGVENPGTFKIQYSKYDGTGKKQTASFEIDPSATTVEATRLGNYESNSEYSVGDTWEVDGQWRLTVTDIQETDERYDIGLNPEAAYIISYTYENLGYEDPNGNMDGLYLDVSQMIIDSDGEMGYSYPGDISDYPQETPVGATCDAQTCIGVNHAGEFDFGFSIYDGNDVKQKALFRSSFENEDLSVESEQKSESEVENETETSQLYKDFFEPYVDGVGSIVVDGFKESAGDKLQNYTIEVTEGNEEDLWQYKIIDDSGEYVYMTFYPINIEEENVDNWIWTLSLLSYERDGEKEISINNNLHLNPAPVYSTWGADRDPKNEEVSSIKELEEFMFGE